MKKKWLALLIAVVVSAFACALFLSACGNKEFKAPENVKVEGNVLTWTEVDKAENGYTVKINNGTLTVEEAELDLTSASAVQKLQSGENKLSVKVNATDKIDESPYSAEVTYTYTPAPSTDDEDDNKGGNDDDDNNDGDDEDDNKGGNDEDDNNDGNDEDDEKDPQPVEISAEAKAFKADVEAINDVEEANIESVRAAITAAETKYSALSETDKADSTVISAKTALDNKKTALDNLISEIQSDVATLKAKIDALDTSCEITLEYYEVLNGLLDEIDELGVYAVTLWDEDDTAKVNSEITRVETTVAEIKKADEVFGWGGTGYLNIVRNYYNVLGDQLSPETAPTVIYTVNDGEEKNLTLEQADNGAYVGTIAFNPTLATEFDYTVSGESQTVLNLAAFKSNIYLTVVAADGERTSAFTKEDKLAINQTYGETTYAYIYLADEIDVGQNISADQHVYISGAAIAKVKVTNGMTRETLYKTIAMEYSELLDKTLEVRLVFISEAEEEGAIVRTGVNSASVSEKITLALTVEDLKEKINLGNAGTVIGDLGNVTIGAAWDTAKLVSQFNDPEITADNVHEQLRYIIDVTLNGETKTFSVNCVSGGSIDANTMQSNIFNLFHNLEDSDYTITLRLALREGSAYSDYLKASEPRTYDWNVRIKLPDNEAQLRFTSDGGFFEFLRTSGGNGSVFNFGVSSVEIKFTNGTDTHFAYLFAGGDSDTKLYLYNNSDRTGTGRDCGTVGNGYLETSNFNLWVISNYGIADFNATDGWTFYTKIVLDGDYEVGGESVVPEYSDPVVYNA